MDDKSYKDKLESFFEKNAPVSGQRNDLDDSFFEEAWGNIAPKVSKSAPNKVLQIAIVVLATLLILSPDKGDQINANTNDTAPLSERKENIQLGKSDLTQREQTSDLIQTKSSADEKKQNIFDVRTKATPDKTNKDQIRIAEERLLTSGNNLNQFDARSDQRRTVQSPSASDNSKFKESMALKGNNHSPTIGSSISSKPANELKRSSDILNLIPGLMPQSFLNEASVINGEVPTIYGYDSPEDAEQLNKNQTYWSLASYVKAGSPSASGKTTITYSNGLSHTLNPMMYTEAGLIGEITFSDKHRIGLGLGIGRQVIEADYSLSVGFTDAGEFSDGQGNLHNNYNHSLPTLAGDVGLSHILFRMQNDQLTEGESINFDLNFLHSVRSIPIQARYDYIMSITPKWSLTPGISLSGQFDEMDNEITELALQSHHSKIHHNYTETTATAREKITAFNLSGSVRCGIEYNFNQWRLFTQLEYQHRLSTSSWFDNQSFNNNLVSGYLGIAYKL